MQILAMWIRLPVNRVHDAWNNIHSILENNREGLWSDIVGSLNVALWNIDIHFLPATYFGYPSKNKVVKFTFTFIKKEILSVLISFSVWFLLEGLLLNTAVTIQQHAG